MLRFRNKLMKSGTPTWRKKRMFTTGLSSRTLQSNLSTEEQFTSWMLHPSNGSMNLRFMDHMVITFGLITLLSTSQKISGIQTSLLLTWLDTATRETMEMDKLSFQLLRIKTFGLLMSSLSLLTWLLSQSSKSQIAILSSHQTHNISAELRIQFLLGPGNSTMRTQPTLNGFQECQWQKVLSNPWGLLKISSTTNWKLLKLITGS